MARDPGNPTRQRVLALMREQLAAMRAHEPGARQARDPEALRRMRVAARRLRAILGAVRDMFPPRWVESLRGELDWLGTVLGPPRDIDVLRDYLRAELRALGPGTRVVARDLVARVEAKRAQARQRMLAALDTPRYARLLQRLGEAVQRPPVRASLFLPDVAAGQFKKLRKAVKALPDDPSDRELHAERRLRGLLARDRRTPARSLSATLIEKHRARREAAKVAFLDRWPGLKRRGRKAWESA